MKKLSFLALVAAGMLLGACADKDDTNQNAANLDEFENGAYIGISLSLPSADNSITRANDDLSNGIEDEFKVHNATLYIFKGTSEANAVYVDYVALGTKYNPDTQGGIDPNDVWGKQNGVSTKDDPEETNDTYIETNITSTSLNEATKISNELAATIKGDNTNNYYAYVIINHNGQIPTMTKNSTTFLDFSREKFDKIGADIALEQNIWDDGMLMTNAPICDKSGGATAPVAARKYSTLVPLDKNKIFSSVAQAKANPAACVYVERAAVKITVEKGSGVASSLIDGYSVSLEGWKVINTEPKYYNTRQINFSTTENGSSQWTAEDWGGYTNSNATPANAKFRFVSYYQFLPTLPDGLDNSYNHTTGFRTYFAADPHYDVDAQAAVDASGDDPAVPSTLNFTTANDSRPWIDPDKHAYTTENTFDVKHQTWRNTTMVTVKAKLSKTGDTDPDFYTVGKGGQTMYSKTDAEALLHNLILNDATVAGKLDACLTELTTPSYFPGQVIKPVLTVTLGSVTAATTGVGISYTLSFTHGGEVVTSYSTSAYTDLIGAINAYIHPEDPDNPGTLLNDKYTDDVLVSFYKGGVMYYNIKIQHFGEFETPWGGGDVVANGSGVNVNEIYFNTPWNGTPDPTAITAGQNKFLGRYGLVRDNWYKLEINGVTKIGSATPEDPSKINPDTPDDEIENYLSVHVHIVPWVLRSQTVIL